MERLHSLLRMHWDHEPTPNPSQEGNFRAADECLLPSWEGSGVGRFMERRPPGSASGCARKEHNGLFGDKPLCERQKLAGWIGYF